MRKTVHLFVSLLLLAIVVGCQSKPEPKTYDTPLAPGEPALRKIANPLAMPDFTPACRNTDRLRDAVENSLNFLGKPSSRDRFPDGPITHRRVVLSLEEFLKVLDADLSPSLMNAYLRRRFDVYTSVGCDGEGTVLFTGYYTPIFRAAISRTARFKYPLYKPPEGLKKLPTGDPASPMPDRRTIESRGLYEGNELVWLADPFEAYVAHVQGSARLRLPDGEEITVGYAANNGHDYKSLRQAMLDDGVIGPEAGLKSMMDYLRAHPDKVREYTWRNPRYIFFRMVPDDSPRGCINEPVIPMRSIATDKSIFPPASLVFFQADLPQLDESRVVVAPYAGFALDQDAGGAIRAPGRCDVYMGLGGDAGRLAGRAKHEGRLYYLVIKQ
ncbi:MAG: MltA domain-containing protein [Planctomycetota bacterium]